jgi:hypothetical protein
MMSQQIELEDKSRTQVLLRNEIKKLRDQLKELETQSIKDLKSKLGLQRKEYEMIIKRHLSFIDKLLGEKEDLTRKCAELVEQVKSLDKSIREKTSKMEDSFKNEIKQQKELWQSAEKIKRDKWISEKSKLIKENTIKGLEPEIQGMLAVRKSK